MNIFLRAKLSALLLVVATVVCLPFQSRAGYSAYIQLTGVAGESVSNQIPLSSYSFGLSLSNGNRATFSQLSVTKSLGSASPTLAFLCAKGTTNTTATLMVVNTSSGNALYTITLSNFSVASDQIGGSTGEVPSESISFNYTAIVWTYQPLDSSGNPVGSPVTHNWNITNNSGS